MPGMGIINDGYDNDAWHDEQEALRAAQKAGSNMTDQEKYLETLNKLATAVTAETIKNTEWKPDCSEKWDFDISLFSLSTRSYPDNTAYATLYLSTDGGSSSYGIPLLEFQAEPGKHLGAHSAREEIVRMANEQIPKFVYALLRITDPKIIQEAAKKAGL